MLIDVLVCRADGTQALEQREVPDNWFTSMDNANAQTEGNVLSVENGTIPSECLGAAVGCECVCTRKTDLQTEKNNASVGEIGDKVGSSSIFAETNCAKTEENTN